MSRDRRLTLCSAELVEAAHQTDLARAFAHEHGRSQKSLGIFSDRPLNIASAAYGQHVVRVTLPPEHEKLVCRSSRTTTGECVVMKTCSGGGWSFAAQGAE